MERQLQAVQWEEQAMTRVKQLTLLGLVLTACSSRRWSACARSRRAPRLTRCVSSSTPTLELDRDRLDQMLGRPLNDTDWNVLNILLSDPAITNRGIAEQAYLSVDGVGSSLRRMYVYFDIRETKYKKMALLHAAMKASAGQA